MATREPWNHIRTPARWIHEIQTRIRQDWDQVIVISGEERSGKSTFAFRLAHALDLHGFAFDRIAFRGQDLMEVADRAIAGNVVWLDEMVEGGSNREAMSRANRALVNYFVVSGERNLIYLLLWPNLQTLDPKIRDQRAHWHVHIPERGIAQVEAADRRGRHRKSTYWRAMPWGDEGEIRFKAVEGAAWERYLRAKREFVEEYGRDLSGGREERDPAEDPVKGLDRIRGLHAKRGPWVEDRAEELAGSLSGDVREVAIERGLIEP